MLGVLLSKAVRNRGRVILFKANEVASNPTECTVVRSLLREEFGDVIIEEKRVGSRIKYLLDREKLWKVLMKMYYPEYGMMKKVLVAYLNNKARRNRGRVVSFKLCEIGREPNERSVLKHILKEELGEAIVREEYRKHRPILLLLDREKVLELTGGSNG